jgi:hypothetical protein
MSESLIRTVNFRQEVFDIIKAEIARRRNGGTAFSLTLNQIVLEWLDCYNAGILPIDTRSLQEMPAVKSVSVEMPKERVRASKERVQAGG